MESGTYARNRIVKMNKTYCKINANEQFKSKY